MRFDTNKSFGYPVLRPNNDDYVEAAFEATIEPSEDYDGNNLCKFDYHLNIGVKEIKNAIQDQLAQIVITVFCPKTFYQFSLPTFEKSGSFEIDLAQMRGATVFSCEITVCCDVFQLNSNKIHPEFSELSPFELKHGHILAQSEPRQLNIEKSSFKSTVSLFDFSESNEISPTEWTYSLEDDHINVFFGSVLNDIWTNDLSNSNSQEIIANSILVPTLAAAISQLRSNGDDFAEKEWAKTIFQKLETSGLSIDSGTEPLRLAQRILKSPFKLFKNIGDR